MWLANRLRNLAGMAGAGSGGPPNQDGPGPRPFNNGPPGGPRGLMGTSGEHFTRFGIRGVALGVHFGGRGVLLDAFGAQAVPGTAF